MKFNVWDRKLGNYVNKAYNKQPRSMWGPMFVDLATKLIMKAQVKVHCTVTMRIMARHVDGSP